MSMQMKDLVGGRVDRAYLNRLIKEDPEAQPAEKGERDKDMEVKHTTAYFPKRHRKKGGGA